MDNNIIKYFDRYRRKQKLTVGLQSLGYCKPTLGLIIKPRIKLNLVLLHSQRITNCVTIYRSGPACKLFNFIQKYIMKLNIFKR